MVFILILSAEKPRETGFFATLDIAAKPWLALRIRHRKTLLSFREKSVCDHGLFSLSF